MAKATAVVLDKDQIRRDNIRIHLSSNDVLPICFDDEWIWLENIVHVRPSFAVFQPDSRETAIRFISITKAIRKALPLIVLSDQKEIEYFVGDNWLSNLFFLKYPIEEQKLKEILALGAKNIDRPVLIAGSSESLKRIQCLPLFGITDEPVLIQGERGVGKKLMAKAIYSCMNTENVKFRYIHASEISGSWIRDASQRINRLHSNDFATNTYVVENIETLPLDLQPQLLLLVENSTINAAHNHIRLITLAENDLERLSREGRFRKDLYHRLSVLKLTVPPLRERMDDVPVLVDFFAAKYGIRNRGSIFRLTENVRSVFMRYHWPGNVMELKTTIESLCAKLEDDWSETLSAWGGRSEPANCRYPADAAIMDVKKDIRRLLNSRSELPLKQIKQRFARQVEARILKEALSQTNGNCKKAAGFLKISYKSMLNKVKAYGLV